MFANHIFDKGLISKIYKELIQANRKQEITQLKYGKGPEQALFWERHTDCQQVHEKVLHHQENPSQEHNEISPLNVTMASSKWQEITCVGEIVEKREPKYTVGGNVNWYSCYGKQCRGKSEKTELPCDPAFHIWIWIQRKQNLHLHPILTSALLTTAKTRK